MTRAAHRVLVSCAANWNTDPYSNTGSPTITPPLGAISYSPLPWKLAAATEYNDQRMGSTPEPPRGTAVSDAPVQPTNVNFVEVAEEPTPPDPNSVAPTSDVKVRGDIQRLDPPLPGFTSPFSILNPHHPFFPRARLRDLDVTEVAEWLQQDVDSERPQYWMPPGSNSDVGQVPFDQLASPYSRYGFVELSAETASRTRASLCVNCVFDDS